MMRYKMDINHIQSHTINKNKNFPYLNESISVIQQIIQKFSVKKITMGTGFGAPGVVLLDILRKINLNISVFYIDTGVLFKETYDLKDKLEDYYNIKFIKIFFQTLTVYLKVQVSPLSKIVCQTSRQ